MSNSESQHSLAKHSDRIAGQIQDRTFPSMKVFHQHEIAVDVVHLTVQ